MKHLIRALAIAMFAFALTGCSANQTGPDSWRCKLYGGGCYGDVNQPAHIFDTQTTESIQS